MTADGKTIITNRECSGIECNKCCDVQNDKDLYPNLKSPDYAFTNDTDERNKHSQIDEMIIENPQT